MQALQMGKYPGVRLLGSASGIQASVEHLGQRVASHTPAVGTAVTVDVVFEVGYDNVQSHHQARQNRVEGELELRLTVDEVIGMSEQ